MLDVVSQDIKAFKLHYSGRFVPCGEECEDLVELFSSVHVLSFYIAGEKRLYTWIGENASQTLKAYIVRFRQIFSEEYPDLRVLRYITVEAGTEPFDFLRSIGISKEDLHSHIDQEVDKLSPVLSKISTLKEQEDNLFNNEQYDQVIEIAKEIISLAEESDNESLRIDQESLIEEAKNRSIATDMLKNIEKDRLKLKAQIENIENSEDVFTLHSQTEKFKETYGEYFDFSRIPDVLTVLEKEEEIWKKYSETREKTREIEDIENQYLSVYESNDYDTAQKIMEEIKEILLQIDDNQLFIKWNEKEAELEEKIREIDQKIFDLEKEIEESKEKEDLYQIKESCEKLLEIGEQYHKPQLIEKYTSLLKDVNAQISEEERKEKEEKEKQQSFENLTINIDDLRKQALTKLDEGSLNESYDFFTQITRKIQNFQNENVEGLR